MRRFGARMRRNLDIYDWSRLPRTALVAAALMVAVMLAEARLGIPGPAWAPSALAGGLIGAVAFPLLRRRDTETPAGEAE